MVATECAEITATELKIEKEGEKNNIRRVPTVYTRVQYGGGGIRFPGVSQGTGASHGICGDITASCRCPLAALGPF